MGYYLPFTQDRLAEIYDKKKTKKSRVEVDGTLCDWCRLYLWLISKLATAKVVPDAGYLGYFKK